MQPLSLRPTVSLRQYLLLRPLVQRGPRRQRHRVPKGRPACVVVRGDVGYLENHDHHDHVGSEKGVAEGIAVTCGAILAWGMGGKQAGG